MKQEKERYVVYIDTGGTFTDCCLVTPRGEVVHGKAHTTPEDLTISFFDALKDAVSNIGVSEKEVLDKCQLVGYGTTEGTNVVVTGKGSCLGLITTKGHEDRTLIGRLRAAGLSYIDAMHIVTADKHAPLIPRERIQGITERVDSFGDVVIPLREDDVRLAVQELLEQKVAGIAVCFLWSFLNDGHEKRVREIIREMAPDMPVAISCEVALRIREYPRFMSTILDLYVGAALRKLLDQISARLRQNNYKYPLLVMQATGGLVRAEITKPVTTLHSGPVGGLIGVDYWRNIYGFKDAISTDVGGTSFDVGVSSSLTEEYLREPIVGRFEISNPMREIRTIGAGGGTIARFDQVSKRLMVGPDSAQAVPGPVCYEKGGTEPTVTDANVVMNRMNPDFFLAGKMKLNRELAIKAIKEKLADPMGMEVVDAAEAVCEVLDGHMESLLRTVMALRGMDAKKCPAFVFGGMGPTHCAGYTANLGFEMVIISPHASIFSALGAGTADVRHRYEASPFVLISNIPYDKITLRLKVNEIRSMAELPQAMLDRFNSMFAEIDNKVSEDMRIEGFSKEEITKYYEIEGRYGGQLWEVKSRTSIHQIKSLTDLATLVREFEEEYIRQYGQMAMVPRGGLEIISIAVVALASPVKPVFRKLDYAGIDSSQALKGIRDVFFKKRWVPTKVYGLEKLLCGNVAEGPAIIEGADTTVVVPEDRKVRVDEYANLIMEWR